jgi:hypothetical protein
MPFRIVANAQASCAGCGKEIKLKDPIIQGELHETDKRPITKVFGNVLGNYQVEIQVDDADSCFVVDDEILCTDCHKEYHIQVSNIELEAGRQKLKIIENIKKERGG